MSGDTCKEYQRIVYLHLSLKKMLLAISFVVLCSYFSRIEDSKWQNYPVPFYPGCRFDPFHSSTLCHCISSVVKLSGLLEAQEKKMCVFVVKQVQTNRHCHACIFRVSNHRQPLSKLCMQNASQQKYNKYVYIYMYMPICCIASICIYYIALNTTY